RSCSSPYEGIAAPCVGLFTPGALLPECKKYEGRKHYCHTLSASKYVKAESKADDTRTLSSGRCLRSNSTAARVSSVGTSPQQASTTSGSPPLSLLAHSQMPRPRVQCLMAWSMVSHCGAGCLPATTRLT